ncbi:hypothetical protein JOC95_000198 [Bacillus tianshenii]|uniref:Flagellar protein FliT n=1 Tax=Sutcliffiella tianshenii TaxID=1463404 RepID=A0ABS2NUN2_9BACI|nr:hypothetical protein [Bacillus tianshenii]MBM7618356.1 hypothetical protein [Bacillus tianshenii]
MTVVEDLDKVTSHLLALLEKDLPAEEERDTYIAEIDKALQVREALLKKLSPPFTDSEQALGRKVADKSQRITPKLEAFQKQLKQEWGQIQQSKKTAKAYGQAYAGVSIDGMYYDKRN